jgi:hypothetical protein
MWPDRSDLSRFMMMTGCILSFAVILATVAK